MNSKLLLSNLLLEYKNEVSQGQECVIPFIEKKDEKKCFKHYKKIYWFNGFSTIFIFIILQRIFSLIISEHYILIPIFILLFLISYFLFNNLKKQKNVLFQEIKNYLYYFLIQDETVILYKNVSIIGEYLLNEITIKPIHYYYYSGIYLYHITYAQVEIGDCYVSIDDWLYLKKFTIHENKVKDDEVES